MILSVFPTFAVGGAQIRWATVANHLGPGIRHAVVAMDGNLGCRERLDPSLDVSFPAIDIRKGDTIGNVRRFRAAIRTLGPRTMLTHNFGSIEWSIANRTGLVRQIHVEDGFGPEERQRQLPRRVWLRRIFLRGRPVALPSLNLMRIAAEVWRLDRKHLHYVPNGIDLARFGGPRTPAPWPGDGPIVGTVAALRPEKNIARLLRAFSLASDRRPARLVIIGDGPERPDLEQLAHTLGIGDRVHFAGHVTDPSSLVKAFDLFALSSDTEQMPISLLEAMAAGLPCVATDVGDVRLMLPDGNRPFVVALDDAALADAIGALTGDPVLRQAVGSANRAKASLEFGQETMLQRWASLLLADGSTI